MAGILEEVNEAFLAKLPDSHSDNIISKKGSYGSVIEFIDLDLFEIEKNSIYRGWNDFFQCYSRG